MQCLAQWPRALAKSPSWVQIDFEYDGVYCTTIPSSYIVIRVKKWPDSAITLCAIFFICAAILILGTCGMVEILT